MAKRIDGKAIATQIKQELKEQVEAKAEKLAKVGYKEYTK